MDKVKISICIPIYNRKNVIVRTLQNILEQSVQETYEILLLDDGSDDGVMELLDNVANNYSNVKWTRNDERDYIKAHNILLSIASGEYITWLDSDDLTSPNRLAALSRYLDEHQDVDVVSSLVMFNRNYGIVNTINELDHSTILKLAKSEQLNKICFFQSAMFRRKCLDIFSDGIYFYPEYKNGFCGQGFMYTLLFNNFKFANTRECIYLYNLGQEQNSISNNIKDGDEVFAETINSLSFDKKKEEILKLFKKYNPSATIIEMTEEKPKKRGRKKKEEKVEVITGTVEAPKKRRGRPKKTETTEAPVTEAPKKRRGRPKKTVE